MHWQWSSNETDPIMGVESRIWQESGDATPLLRWLVPLLLALWFGACWDRLQRPQDDLPVVNRSFAFEPSFVSRLRFAFNARRILADAYRKYKGRAYRIARGDTDFVVLPSECVTELNRLPERMISSRQCHSFSMIGHLTGMETVLTTNFHVRALLNRITPSLPRFLQPASVRMADTMQSNFPQSTSTWTAVNATERVAASAGRAVALAVVGAPLCDDPEFTRLMHEHTKDLFMIMMVMRLVPATLQPMLVWLMPSKWRHQSSLKKMETFVASEMQKQREKQPDSTEMKPLPSLLTCMMEEVNQDPALLTQLLAVLSAGGIYSVANFIFSVLLDLTAHPHFLEEIRAEIREKHAAIDGKWNYDAFDSLPKLDSAFKESMRLAPGALTIYSRVMQQEYTLENGVRLRKGQFICVDSRGRAEDDSVHPDAHKYDALRAYNESLENHLNQPFRGAYWQDLRWGAGRWACAGRYLATLLCKFITVKLLDEYEFRLPGDGCRPANSAFHEFVFLPPNVQIEMRRRQDSLGISCC